jgi:hypothetical protein
MPVPSLIPVTKGSTESAHVGVDDPDGLGAGDFWQRIENAVNKALEQKG